jgi:hypothetical protein
MSRRPLTHRISACELEDVVPRPIARPRRLVIDVVPEMLPQRSQRRERVRHARSSQ